MVQHRSQSALEFLSTYAFVFLMLAIVISLLFVFASLPRSLLPSQCTFYSGFTCMQAIYTINMTAGHGAELFVVAEDTQPGTVNVSSFSAYLNFHTSNAGSCEPSVATAGQRIYCIANFTATPTLASTYDGTFRMNADYCASGLNTISNESCRANGNFSYTGHITIQASKFNLGRTMLVPLTLTNSQNAAVPAHFDQMVDFSASQYLPYVNSNLGNIRFYYGGKELYSWCESSCNTSSTSNSIFWIRLPQAIPANSVMPVEMYILPQSVDYTGKHAGEASQWTCPDPANTASCSTYGKYDNGASVFKQYWNFAGTSLPSGWTYYNAAPTVNNGLNFASTDELISTTTTYPITNILEASVSYPSTTNNMGFGYAVDPSGNPYTYYSNPWIATGSAAGRYYSGVFENLAAGNSFGSVKDAAGAGFGTTAPGIIGVVSTGTTSYGYSSRNVYSTTSSVPPTGNYYIEIGDGGGSGLTVQWLRTRAYPPNGVMPSVSFGATGPA